MLSCNGRFVHGSAYIPRLTDNATQTHTGARARVCVRGRACVRVQYMRERDAHTERKQRERQREREKESQRERDREASLPFRSASRYAVPSPPLSLASPSHCPLVRCSLALPPHPLVFPCEALWLPKSDWLCHLHLHVGRKEKEKKGGKMERGVKGRIEREGCVLGGKQRRRVFTKPRESGVKWEYP